MNSSKVYLCFITQDDPKQVKEITEVWESFDGIFCIDHSLHNGTASIIYKRKKGGFYVHREFYNNTGHSANDYLLHPKIRNGDWVCIIDTSERVNFEFAKNIKNTIYNLDSQGIGSVYLYGKLFLTKKNLDCYFLGSPHWTLVNASDKKVELSEDPYWKNARENKRPETRPKDHSINHFLKYFLWADVTNNHMLMECNNDIEEYKRREIKRRQMLRWMQDENIPLVVKDFINYLSKSEDDIPQKLKDYIQEERILRNAYRLNILDHKFEDIKANEEYNILWKTTKK